MKRIAHITEFLLAAALSALLPVIANAQQPVASFHYDERGNVVRQEQDTNGDGRMDRWTHYNPQGQTLRIEQDVNFDGKPDIICLLYTSDAADERSSVDLGGRRI